MQADSVTAERLEALLDTPSDAPARWVAPGSGRVVVVQPAGAGVDQLEIRSPDGAIELAVRLTAAGPVLSLSAVGIELTAVDKLSLKCREFDLEATEQASLRTGGDLLLQAQGEMDLHARGDCRVVANILFLN